MAHIKADIIEAVAYKIGLQKTEARDIVEVILSLMKEALINGEYVKIPNFGTFHVRKKRARAGRNPKTGQGLEITPMTVVSFHRCSKLAKSVSNAEKTDDYDDTEFVIKPRQRHNWPALWAEYQTAKAQNKTLTEFSREKGIARALVSREFGQFRQASDAKR
ncbi:MAG: integration host factor subunit alpha [Candidatus Magnetominusculus sp. LBB02]|nr:integration host factor subunit alpha [Candidatus Magnetominusculus sp. LBB02]